VTVPIYALNQVSDERCEWLVPGMLHAKVLALCKTLHQRPRSRLVPLPDFAAEFCELTPFAQGGLMDALLKAVRERTQLAVQRNDFKLEQLQPHHFMNFRIVDEHGRQLGAGRDLASLKAELGAQARSAFQALAVLKSAALPAPAQPVPAPPAPGGRGVRAEIAAPPPPVAAAPAQHTAWTFGELPELMEVRRGSQVLVGFPALIDKGQGVEIEVFDEPEVAAAKHRAGLRRLVALQIKEPLKYLEKNIPDLQQMAGASMALGTLEELREQIVAVALDRAFLAEPLPTDEAAFKRRLEEGRTRLNLIAAEVARQAQVVLFEFAGAQRKLKDSKPPKDVAEDIATQLQRLVPKRFLMLTPWAALQHLPRYLKAVVLRLDKLRGDPARDATRLAELRPLEQRYLRRLAELKGAGHARLDEYRWLLEELRVSLFAQELRTPQPVSAKRLDKAWAQIDA
jgi:ATP-dependent helicase HrpA